MPGNKRGIGAMGEDAVCDALRSRGARILARNFTIRGGELDIVAQSGELLLFVEVKTRGKGAMVPGAAAVDKRKQYHILRAAREFLRRNPLDLQPRFDVAEVTYSGDTVRGIRYIANAFDASDTDI